MNDGASRLVLGTNGPPNPPIPFVHERNEVINGVAVQEFSAPDGLGRTELLARFPEHPAWLRATVPGGETAHALVRVRQILESVHVRTTPASRPTPQPAWGSFLGHWYVHGGTLDILSSRAGVTGDPHGCDNDCLAQYTLRLETRRQGARLRATVTRVDYIGNDGKAVRRPNTGPGVRPGDVYRVGDWFELEFVEPHLLMSLAFHDTVPTLDPGFGFGNPYWCGEHLSEAVGSFVCGL